MSTGSPDDLSNVAAIIPALNEAEALGHLLPALQRFTLGQVIVCDNGSTDETRDVARMHGAIWIYEPKRGYGAACYAGIEHLAENTDRIGLPIDTVVFIDADQTREVELLPALVEPIARGDADFVIGARIPGLREAGSATWPQRFGNWLMPNLIRWGWGHRYMDLGPFRAIRREPLEAMGMRDRAYGWTIEMQIRAVELGLRILEIPIPHRKREHGRDKISGTVRGTALAGYWIVKTCASMWLTKRGRGKKLRVKSDE
ncbi:MAG: glycosyltransferase family 2 protein [Planctomycetes bacterium]|nr:glycosyltransferase family 2 protein [Planctomycetota bacterium]